MCGGRGARTPYTCRMQRRVVITGLGTVTGLGVGIGATWDGLEAGRSALRRIGGFDPSGFPCRLAAEVPGFSARDFVPKWYRKAVKVMARDAELAVAAAKLAVEDAALVTRGTLPEGSAERTTYPGSRMGCHIGAGLLAAETDELTSALATAVAAPGEGEPGSERRGGFSLRAWGTEGDGARGGMNNLQPLWMLKYLPNMLACHVTIIHGAEGPSNTITCAEASGLLSVGESARVVERGDADLCFSGGAESKVNLMGLLRMELAGRLAHTGDADDGARFVRPYDPGASGGLLGEGGGIVVLEAHETASARGARVHAEVLGCGAAQSVAPDPTGLGSAAGGSSEGLEDAVRAALDDAGLGPDDISAIVPHASGIASMDEMEGEALRRVFGAHIERIPLVVVTPMIGDCMAGGGALQAAVGALCVSRQRLPARVHAGAPVPWLCAGPAPARDAALSAVLVCTGSLGGQNAAVVLGRAG